MGNYIIIPARTQSKRYPKKVFAKLSNGDTLLETTYKSCLKSKIADGVLFAVDGADTELTHFCTQKHLPFIVTGKEKCGTDRVAAAAIRLKDPGLIINCQVDYPGIKGDMLDCIFDNLRIDCAVTLAYKQSVSELFDPNCVKVWRDYQNHAIWFTRMFNFPLDHYGNPYYDPLIHIGVYGFRFKTLLRCYKMDSRYGRCEDLEQLNWLYYALAIRVIKTNRIQGINTPEDLS